MNKLEIGISLLIFLSGLLLLLIGIFSYYGAWGLLIGSAIVMIIGGVLLIIELRNYFKNYNNGSLYFIINKKEITKNNSTYTIYIEGNGNEPRIFNPLGDNIPLSEIIKTFPVLESRLIEIVGVSSIYTALLSNKK